ncbi:LysR family transcriptional regulator [Glacieibacterium sp.]|uniref:LysR family transcriptional regulator n=1 Tax=Glacieibacterium sp. TaxID=2860237 RepID=UPI003B00DE4B
MQLRSVEYFCVLAREEHFARAAELCGVSQPTLSAGILALERLLGQRLVVRDRRYIGLTAEGRAVLPLAQQMVATFGAMRLAAAGGQELLDGEVRLGTIPAALPSIGPITDALSQRHPGLRIAITSLSSRQIDRGLEEYELDAGITYLDNEPLPNVLQVELYRERYIVVAHRDLGLAPALSWTEAAALPLCLLPLSMQNRRILDVKLAAAGTNVTPRATANSYVALLSMLRAGTFASIMPNTYAPYIVGDPSLSLHQIAGQADGTAVGLVVRDRRPLAPLAHAVFVMAQSEAVRLAFARTLAASVPPGAA